MATKKNLPTTKKVRQTTVEEFEEPIEELEVIEEAEPAENDPLQQFFGELDANRSLTMHVWELTLFKTNPVRGRRAPGAVYITMFPFSASDVETYRATIQTWQPKGGMFYIEVREGGKGIIKSWSEEIGPMPGMAVNQQQSNQPPYAAPPYAPVVVHQHPQAQQQAQQPVATPGEIMREHIGLAKDLVSMAKDLMPAPPNVVVNPNGNGSEQERPSLVEQIIVAAVPKLIEAGKPNDLKEMLGVLAGSNQREPSFLEATGPVLLELMKHVGPRIGQGLDLWILSQQQRLAKEMREAGVAMQQAQPQQSQQPQQQLAQPPDQAAPQPPTDLATRAWLRVVYKLIEDCDEAAKAPNDNMKPNPEATASVVVDLVDRFEAVVPYVERLIADETTPEQVVDLCCSIINPQHAPTVATLKQSAAAMAWLAELQQEVRKQLSEDESEDEKGES